MRASEMDDAGTAGALVVAITTPFPLALCFHPSPSPHHTFKAQQQISLTIHQQSAAFGVKISPVPDLVSSEHPLTSTLITSSTKLSQLDLPDQPSRTQPTAIMSEPLAKVDSAVDGLSTSPNKEEGAKKTRRASSLNPDVKNITDLEEQGIELELAPETQKTGWKINSSPNTVEDPAILKMPLTKPLLRKIDLHFPLGKEVTARNLKGVTIKDALEAIHKAYKKRADDELDKPYLAGFEWDKEESWTRLVVHLQTQPTNTGGGSSGGKKKKNKKNEE
ncbi:WD repeat containing 44 [Fusarium albosuccineum]|uniref:WD repeat containing 44 n=1 Tax=Fusarium albosuccineum TaxID=1237068 RepID=A0A8H4PLF1_9HYPO|nr:WD repeat containing 44 [Fusarium albosuccineum]